MSRRQLNFLLVALTALAALAGSVIVSQASYTDATNNPQTATGDNVTRWLSLYSQGSDPDGLTSYATRAGSSPVSPAATGSDSGLSVNLGGHPSDNGVSVARVFTLKTPATIPESVTAITATASTTADSATGKQPITAVAITNTNGGSAATARVMTAATKLQIRLTLKTNSLTTGTQYIPTVKIIVTFTGSATTFLQYNVPVKIYVGSGAGPN